MISLHIRIVVPQTDQTRRAAQPRPRIPPSRCGACPCCMHATQRRMWTCSALQAGKLAWARGDPSHARHGERGPETEARGNKTRGTETRGIEAEHSTEAPERACATSTPDPSETTDDGCTAPILRVSDHREQRVPQSAAPAPPRPATVAPMPSPRHPPRTQPVLAADGACDVFDSQCQRYHAPALKATNIMRLLDLSWFRTECDHTLRTRLGPGLYCSD